MKSFSFQRDTVHIRTNFRVICFECVGPIAPNYLQVSDKLLPYALELL